jgi:hypothetical protein
VVSAFGLRVVIEGGLDHEIGRNLRRLFDDREYVDYALGEAPAEQSLSAIGDADDLLDATTRWIERRLAAASTFSLSGRGQRAQRALEAPLLLDGRSGGRPPGPAVLPACRGGEAPVGALGPAQRLAQVGSFE